jgi:DNA replication protein DnaC
MSAELCRACREKSDQEAKVASEARIRARLERFLEQPGAEEHQASTLDNFDPNPDRAALAAARGLVDQVKDGFTPSLYLYSERPGEPMALGTGKTHLAIGIARELVAAGKSVAITRVNRLMLEVYRTFKRQDADALDVVTRYSAPDVVVLDDLGAEKWNEYNLSVLYEIISSRAHKVTIITSNYSLGDLDANDTTGYMPRITSRLAGTCKLVRMTGPDRRLRRNRKAA